MNKKKIYLDYAATTPVDSKVLKAMEPYFAEYFGNPGSLHRFGQEASAAVFRARRIIAEAIGADYRELIFTGSATEANNLALRGSVKNVVNVVDVVMPHYNKRARASDRTITTLQPPRIIVSSIEHESILETAKDLEKEGVEVVYLPVSREGIVDLKKLEQSLNERTVLVSVMYANNEVGTIQPIAKISKVIRDFRNARNVGNVGNVVMQHYNKRARASDRTITTTTTLYPLFHTDAVQALQYLDCGVNKLRADLITLSAHKIYGPKGIGLLYRRISKSQILKPIITGGGQEDNLRSGTENVPYIVGFGKAVEVAVKRREEEKERVKRLRDYFWSSLRKIFPQAQTNADITQTNADSPRKSVLLPNNLNIYFPNTRAEDFLIKLDLAGIAASSGSACASRALEPSYVLRALGFSEPRAKESVRFTLGRGTTKRDIDITLKVIKNILKPQIRT